MAEPSRSAVMSYWRRVLRRAWDDTRGVAKPKQRREIAFAAIVALFLAGILYATLGPLQTLDWLRGAIAAVIAFLAAFAIFLGPNLMVAPARLAAEDANKIATSEQAQQEFAARLAPTFRLSPGAVNEIGGQPAVAFVSVENLGLAEATNCRGRLIAIARLGATRKQNLDIPLAWAQPDNLSDSSRKSFYGAARLNVAHRGGTNPNYMLPVSAHPLDVIDVQAGRFDRDADLLVGVEVSADGAAPTVGWFTLHWRSFIMIDNEEAGSATIYDLHGAQLTFEIAAE
jgi:hypothetical protein